MRKKINKAIIGLSAVIIAMVAIAGCTKDVTVTIDKSKEITKTISFNKDLVPIFVSSCVSSGCHNTGGKAPDLSPDKAYNELVTGKYFDKGDPENSEMYLWLTGEAGTPMPMGSANNPSSLNEMFLAWVKQGAKNN